MGVREKGSMRVLMERGQEGGGKGVKKEKEEGQVLGVVKEGEEKGWE